MKYLLYHRKIKMQTWIFIHNRDDVEIYNYRLKKKELGKGEILIVGDLGLEFYHL